MLGQRWRERWIFFTKDLNMCSSETTGSINESSGHFLAVFILKKRESFWREEWHLRRVFVLTKTGSRFDPKHCVLLNKTKWLLCLNLNLCHGRKTAPFIYVNFLKVATYCNQPAPLTRADTLHIRVLTNVWLAVDQTILRHMKGWTEL